MSQSEALGELKEARVGAGTVRYRERGEGGPLVFVHGALVTGDLWRKVVPVLAGGHRCITIDMPLGSHQPALDPDADLTPPALGTLITEVMSAAGLEQATLVGNDSGGALCQLAAVQHPDRVSHLVLTNCDAFDNFPPLLFRYLQWSARMPGALYLLAQSMRLPLSRRLPIAYGLLSQRPVDGSVLASYVRPIIEDAGVRRDAAKFLKGISPKYTLAAAEQLARSERPTLLAWGVDDRLFPFEHAQRLSELLPNARLERIEDCRTFVPEDQPDRLAEAIGSFMRETAAQPAVS